MRQCPKNVPIREAPPRCARAVAQKIFEGRFRLKGYALLRASRGGANPRGAESPVERTSDVNMGQSADRVGVTSNLTWASGPTPPPPAIDLRLAPAVGWRVRIGFSGDGVRSDLGSASSGLGLAAAAQQHCLYEPLSRLGGIVLGRGGEHRLGRRAGRVWLARRAWHRFPRGLI